ncbi:hypothetical protein IV203_034179 [Nitzschia inconspicua]|uniref:HD/PDEase domain-containing protein n=1 Tax=Nitzschia inconspicua TaxID=303405 RepID=A0A9K3M5B1_9STRA|nr:hypothetical protein IV203_034179 [Nitzschia inconspicua]
MRVDSGDDAAVQVLLDLTQQFYDEHRHLIKESHGWRHARKVYEHACHALQSCHQQLEATSCLEIQMAALLHDVDDSKYFDRPKTCKDLKKRYSNAVHILRLASVAESSVASILFMIDQVSCSKNGNSVRLSITKDHSYHWLIPRWADRIEAVGARGVWRCYQYNQEHGAPLSSSLSPRPTTVDELWSYATPERFEEYQQRGGSSTDMISHYYDKLLHVACPPKDIVRNSYLEQRLQFSAKELIEVCLHYGCTGVVDEDYIQSLKC